MNNVYKLSLAAIAASVALVGCGGGSSSGGGASMDIGYFVDTYVSGLDYACSSGKTDKTTSEGEFSCNAGDTVKFSVGGFSLGGEVAASSGIVSPYTLWPDSTAGGSTAINVAQLLLSLDTNTSDDIITVADINLSGLNFEINSTNFDQDMDAALIDAGVTTGLVTNNDAQTHLDQSQVLFFISGNTFYLFDQGIERLEFSADGTSVTITDLVDGTSDTMEITISGDSIIAADGTTVVVDMASLNTDYIMVTTEEGGVILDEFWYLNQEDRLRSLLANNTWTSGVTTLIFNADVTSVSGVDADGSFTDTITLDGMEITHTEGTEVIMIENNTTLIFNPGTMDAETFNLVQNP